jgi:hypothetical protein
LVVYLHNDYTKIHLYNAFRLMLVMMNGAHSAMCHDMSGAGGRWEKKNLFIIFKHIFSEIVTPFSNVWTIVVFIFDTKIKYQIWIFFKFLYLWFSRYLKWIGTTLHFYCINISDVWCQHLFKNIEHILWREHIMCNHYANELTKFIQNLEKKIINVLLILLHLYIKF